MPLFEGWLNKQGHLRKNWKRRYFVLSQTQQKDQSLKRLEYYSGEETIPPNRLGKCDVLSAQAWAGKEHGIIVRTLGAKTFYLCANDAANQQAFLEAAVITDHQSELKVQVKL